RYLIGRKLDGQLDVLRSLFPEATNEAAEVQATTQAAPSAPTLADIRLAEAQGAAAYWRAWEAVAVSFAPKDAQRIPAHWRSFGGRGSALTGNPRLASSPPN